MGSSLTLYDKLWQSHLIKDYGNGYGLIYIDRHLVHEVTSPQAFDGLRRRGLQVRAPQRTLAVVDHNIPTRNRNNWDANSESGKQVAALANNSEYFGIKYFDQFNKYQGIVHVIGPENGFILPGMTVVCGDSHTSTHGAFGSLAQGIGTSEVEHVLATQCLLQKKANNMRISVEGSLKFGVTAKDIILGIIGKIGTAGCTGCVVEYAGSAFTSLSMEGRMTVCNMSIEAGAVAGLIAPDDKTVEYVTGRRWSPKGKNLENAVSYWKTLYSDDGAVFDKEVSISATDFVPYVTWGTSPQDVTSVLGVVPNPSDAQNKQRREAMQRSLEYMGLKPGTKISDIEVQKVFIGSCTNGRIEDLRAAAKIIKGNKVKEGVQVLVVPGSGLVKQQAESEGLDKVFVASGCEWREPGCSMCLAMNDDKLGCEERAASTSNRNFEGRQGYKGRTHLVSPAMAAAAAVTGHFCDIRQWS